MPTRPAATRDLLDSLPEVLSTGEVAKLFGVNVKTVARWDHTLKPFRTVGGARRFHKARVAAVLENRTP